MTDTSIHPELQQSDGQAAVTHAKQQSDLPSLVTNQSQAAALANTPSQRYSPYPLGFQQGANPRNLSPSNGLSSPTNAGQQQLLDDGMGEDGDKPPVGSEEWHRMRRSNHKEVERRRRENINEGITELAKLISKEYPGADKNKGAILSRAVQYIRQLKENEAINIERWTLEKLLCDQTIAELTTKNEKLRAEAERAWREVGVWRKAAAGGEGVKAEDHKGKDAMKD